MRFYPFDPITGPNRLTEITDDVTKEAYTTNDFIRCPLREEANRRHCYKHNLLTALISLLSICLFYIRYDGVTFLSYQGDNYIIA